MNGSGRGCSGTETWTRKDTTGTVGGARSPRRRHIGYWQVWIPCCSGSSSLAVWRQRFR